MAKKKIMNLAGWLHYQYGHCMSPMNDFGEDAKSLRAFLRRRSKRVKAGGRK